MRVTVDDMHESDVTDVLAVESGVTSGRLNEELARPWARLRVARGDDGRAVGFLLVWHVPGEIHVLDVAVHAAERRRGIGRALMNDALTDARARGAERMYLEVRRTNAPAIALYRSLGFVAFNVRKGYYPDGEDAIEMKLELDPSTGRVIAGKDEVNVDGA